LTRKVPRNTSLSQKHGVAQYEKPRRGYRLRGVTSRAIVWTGVAAPGLLHPDVIGFYQPELLIPVLSGLG